MCLGLPQCNRRTRERGLQADSERRNDMVRSRTLMLLAVMILATTALSFGEVVFSVSFGPPVLPVYAQPVAPGPGYIWAPGYWGWSGDDYYWVPGTWVIAPQ